MLEEFHERSCPVQSDDVPNTLIACSTATEKNPVFKGKELSFFVEEAEFYGFCTRCNFFVWNLVELQNMCSHGVAFTQS